MAEPVFTRNALDDTQPPQRAYDDYDAWLDPKKIPGGIAQWEAIRRMVPNYSPEDGRLAEIGEDRRGQSPLSHWDMIKHDLLLPFTQAEIKSSRPPIDWRQGPLPGPSPLMPYVPTKP